MVGGLCADADEPKAVATIMAPTIRRLRAVPMRGPSGRDRGSVRPPRADLAGDVTPPDSPYIVRRTSALMAAYSSSVMSPWPWRSSSSRRTSLRDPMAFSSSWMFSTGAFQPVP